MSDNAVIVAGGGIGGLAAALSVARAGHRVVVLEQASELGEIGAGIQIAPNAFHCFDALGVGEEARARAVYVDALRLMDATNGEDLVNLPVGDEFRAHFGNPYAVVHRADLHGVLLRECRANSDIELRTRHAIASYEQEGSSVTAVCRDGTRVRGAALVGADGLNSAVRAQLVNDGAPRISGHTTYRSVIPTEQMPEDLRWNVVTLWAGPKCHIVHYPLKGGKVFNLVVTYHNDAPEAVAGKPVPTEEVARGFEQIHPRARQVIDHGRDWKLWVLCDREPVTRWTEGRVAILGDAAHPMLQYFAQGACMALEDGVVLGRALAAHRGDIEAGLTAYANARMVRTARVQLNARLIGDYIYHPDEARAMVRNSVMRAMTPEDWYRQLDWIYGRGGIDLAPSA